jgi:hypothetical protein
MVTVRSNGPGEHSLEVFAVEIVLTPSESLSESAALVPPVGFTSNEPFDPSTLTEGELAILRELCRPIVSGVSSTPASVREITEARPSSAALSEQGSFDG